MATGNQDLGGTLSSQGRSGALRAEPVSQSQAEPPAANAIATQVQQAEFSQSRNDMYWKLYAGPDGFIRWGGYDDANWWNNVSKTDHARQRVGKETGRTFTIDFDTGEITIAEQVSA